jgi:hypothetical protein
MEFLRQEIYCRDVAFTQRITDFERFTAAS